MLAYFDCFSGISGDMTLGAFIDLGVPVDWLKTSISDIPLSGFDIEVSSVSQNGIQAKNVYVRITEDAHSRNYETITNLIENSPLPSTVKKTSLDIFEKIAAAESEIHGCPKEKVHFHETGGIDAIVDIVGTALCVEYLGIETISASTIPLGSGFVTCRHGTLPVPAPATIAILQDVPVVGTGIPHELVTPTGAAIITTLSGSFGPAPEMVVQKTGYGAGKHKLESRPNLLRIITGTLQELKKDRVVIVETCIDDMNPEVFGFLMDRLFDDGALDVYWLPVFMKKNRPGTMVQVLCDENRREAVVHRILSETTSLGVRYYEAHRSVLERKQIEINTRYGMVKAKQIVSPDGSARIVPEYEVCRKIALEKNVPLKIVYETILKEATP